MNAMTTFVSNHLTLLYAMCDDCVEVARLEQLYAAKT
jgi:hypothetical protein